MNQTYINKGLLSQNIFSSFMQKETIFKNKTVLLPSFVPEKISYRDNEISQISAIMAPVLRGYKPNNLFVYGGVGTGKTITTKYVLRQLKEASKALNTPMSFVYINCKMKKVADTEYRILAQMLKDMGEIVPDTGLPTDVLYRRFFDIVANKKQPLIIVLDEIDVLIRKIGDEFLYNFTRINTDLEDSSITIIGITNDLSFKDSLDIRIKSSLGDDGVVFKPYDAFQLKNILAERAKEGFIEGSVGENILGKCAAMAAQEHGDARRALDIIRVAGEVSERMGDIEVTERHVDMAEEKIDVDRVTETIKIQPKQSQAVLGAIIKINTKAKDHSKWTDSRVLTGDVYNTYKDICNKNNIRHLTQRRVSDLIGELDMLGIITASTVSRGRYGRTREISLAINENVIENIACYLGGIFGV